MGAGADPLDEELSQLRQAGDLAALARRWLEALGPEIYSFLAAIPIAGIDTDDLFADFCEQLWRAFPGFRWDCSARTWSYLLARATWQRGLTRSRRARVTPLSDNAELSALIARSRTATAEFMRTEVKDEFRKLREALAPEDRILLILRVDRQLGWTDVARVLAPEVSAKPAELSKQSARVRKQFQRVKARIRMLARDRGLVVDADDR